MKIHFISYSRVNISHCECKGKSSLLHWNEPSDLWTLIRWWKICGPASVKEYGKYEHTKFWKTGGKVTYPALQHLLFLSQENGKKPVDSIWNQIWSPNIWKLLDKATWVDYTEMCRQRIWHLLNMLRCLVTVSEALKNFPLWESHLAGHPHLLNEKFFVKVKVKGCPEPDWLRTKRYISWQGQVPELYQFQFRQELLGEQSDTPESSWQTSESQWAVRKCCVRDSLLRLWAWMTFPHTYCGYAINFKNCLGNKMRRCLCMQ